MHAGAGILALLVVRREPAEEVLAALPPLGKVHRVGGQVGGDLSPAVPDPVEELRAIASDDGEDHLLAEAAEAAEVGVVALVVRLVVMLPKLHALVELVVEQLLDLEQDAARDDEEGGRGTMPEFERMVFHPVAVAARVADGDFVQRQHRKLLRVRPRLLVVVPEDHSGAARGVHAHVHPGVKVVAGMLHRRPGQDAHLPVPHAAQGDGGAVARMRPELGVSPHHLAV
mmetsp:Transcript_28875/g.76827  ORF Transcript_28875/g.76827 Transcript_28875/m.76827 type:complete len:228 (+) Transcript_28875:387-1070(+)